MMPVMSPAARLVEAEQENVALSQVLMEPELGQERERRVMEEGVGGKGLKDGIRECEGETCRWCWWAYSARLMEKDVAPRAKKLTRSAVTAMAVGCPSLSVCDVSKQCRRYVEDR
jgi:hypothetical protein